MTIGQLIGDLIGDGQLQNATATVESWGPLNALLTELGRGVGLGAGAIRWLFRRRSTDGQVELGPGRSDVASGTSSEGRPELVVCASGNLALVYLNARPERLTLEALGSLYPGLVEALAQHEGIGFVLVRSEREGALAIGSGGRNELDHGRVVGVDPLAPFGPDAADDLRRLDAMPNVGDIVLNSRLDPDTEEVAAFEELVGSHGGLGGWQTRAFILHPADWALPANGRLLGAPAVHTQLVSWLEAAGIREAKGKPLA
jgi:hypothetical protein